jgi:hypothetical protein
MKECPHRIELELERRPGNALNVEIGAPAPRCINKRPDHWAKLGVNSSFRWLASGGSALVFGLCTYCCRRKEK